MTPEVSHHENGKRMKRVVLSGVNLSDMGPLEVYRQALQEVVRSFGDDYEIVALVHRQSLFSVPGVRYLEYPRVKGSWVRRLKFEYFDLKAISKELNADLWLSMHDLTPTVSAKRRAVYCHNPAPFYTLRVRDLFFHWRFAAVVLFYGYLYGVGIKNNNVVIVQQDWLRGAFRRRYGINNIVVAHPASDAVIAEMELPGPAADGGRFRFVYPAYPRLFKNFETLLEACRILEQGGMDDFEVWVTLDATVNKYARFIAGRFDTLHTVKLLGVLDRAAVFDRYRRADCMVFPSRLETWGLPITEFKMTGRPMIVADLPYARETVGSYGKVAFFDVDDPVQLATLMKSAIRGQSIFTNVQAKPIAAPFASNWRELWQLLLSSGCTSPMTQPVGHSTVTTQPSLHVSLRKDDNE